MQSRFIDLFTNNKHAYENIFIPLPSKASGQVIFLKKSKSVEGLPSKASEHGMH